MAVAAAGLLAVAVACCHRPLLVGTCRWLDVGAVPGCVDHVLVLPGEENTRPVVAACLVKSGLARDVLLPQTASSADVRDGITPPTAKIIESILRYRGIPDERIVRLEGRSRTTFDDARALAAYLADRPGEQVAVVTNSFHTRRARYIFGKVFGSRAVNLHFVSAPNPGFDDESWWRRRCGLRFILAEYCKLGFYVVRYGSPVVWLGIGSLLSLTLLTFTIQSDHGRTRPHVVPAAGPTDGVVAVPAAPPDQRHG
jgi:uncharacterized SAM-binding protein YcdF (DUF218 family)